MTFDNNLMDDSIPALKRTLGKLRGERWKAIPAYETAYEVSNYGRVKSLERTIVVYFPSRNAYVERPIRERILKQKIVRHYNRIPRDYRYECLVRLFDDAGENTELVSRLVFSAFKKPLCFEQDNLCIFHKDGNGLNNKPSNLTSGYKCDALKRAYCNSRHITPFALKSPSERKLIGQKSADSRKKPVIQRTLNGEFIRQHDSAKTASDITGITNICQVLKKRARQAGGYRWEYANEKDKVVSSRKEKKEKTKQAPKD